MTAEAPAVATEPSPASATPARLRFAGFDGLRAIAALAIVFHHAAFPTGRSITGWPVGAPGSAKRRLAELAFGSPPFAGILSHLKVGVAVFFVISGFLLYRPFVAATIADGRPVELRSYFVRRFLRVFPAYWAALFLIQWWIGFNGAQRIVGVRSQLEHFLLVHVYFRVDAYQGISQAWTLAVEITFYAFLPLWALLLARTHRRARRWSPLRVELVALGALAVASIAFRAFAYWGPSRYLKELGVYWLPANLDWFALGMAVAVLSVWCARDPAFARRVERWAVGGAWWALAAVAFWFAATRADLGLGLQRRDGWKGFVEHGLYGATALGLLVPVALGDQTRGVVRRFLRLDAVAFVGTVSYGLYLWHQAWIGKALVWQDANAIGTGPLPPFLPTLAVGLGLGLAAATASWYAVERPAMRLGTRVGRRRAS